jgi:hypothetical protein
MAAIVGREMLKQLDHPNCITKRKKDNLWVCLAAESARCPLMIIYGPDKYCLHEHNTEFGGRPDFR